MSDDLQLVTRHARDFPCQLDCVAVPYQLS